MRFLFARRSARFSSISRSCSRWSRKDFEETASERRISRRMAFAPDIALFSARLIVRRESRPPHGCGMNRPQLENLTPQLELQQEDLPLVAERCEVIPKGMRAGNALLRAPGEIGGDIERSTSGHEVENCTGIGGGAPTDISARQTDEVVRPAPVRSRRPPRRAALRDRSDTAECRATSSVYCKFLAQDVRDSCAQRNRGTRKAFALLCR